MIHSAAGGGEGKQGEKGGSNTDSGRGSGNDGANSLTGVNSQPARGSACKGIFGQTLGRNVRGEQGVGPTSQLKPAPILATTVDVLPAPKPGAIIHETHRANGGANVKGTAGTRSMLGRGMHPEASLCGKGHGTLVTLERQSTARRGGGNRTSRHRRTTTTASRGNHTRGGIRRTVKPACLLNNGPPARDM